MNNRRWFTILLASIMMIGLLSACSGDKNKNGGNSGGASSSAPSGAGASKAADPIKLTMWGGVPPESGPQAVVDAWNAAHPDVQVEYVRFVNDDDGNLKLDTAMLTDQGVDIYVNYTLSQTEKRVEAGVALDLSELGDYNIDEKMGPDAALWKINDKYYGVPTKKNAFFVALNKDMLDAAGLAVPKSWTWDEARQYAKQLKADGRYGFIQHLEPFYDPMDSVLVKEGYTKADGSSNLDHPLIRKWLETLNGMMKEDQSTPPLGEQMSTQLPVDTSFLSGQAAMLNIGEWLIRSSNNMTDFPRDFKIAFAPVPRLADNEADYITRGGLGDFVSVNAKSKHKNEAWEFVKWYADGGMAPMAAGGRLPASKDVDKQVAMDSLLGDKADTYDLASLEYVLYGDTTPTYVRGVPQQVIDLRTQEYEKYFLGSQNIDKTIGNMVSRHNDFLKQ
ncbi:ABC transporter substrate-binding protein [Cohnella sp. 56]|uniref:ABC transporter substrate-binding protein n=1 Tax=Cohnella sp. 56 TaxID=3113722 RepID=UPI0030E7F177